jgi:hypothetical protein
MQNQMMVSYGERSAIQAGTGGRADLEGATASMSTEVGDLDAALAALYQLPLDQFLSKDLLVLSQVEGRPPRAGRSGSSASHAPPRRSEGA